MSFLFFSVPHREIDVEGDDDTKITPYDAGKAKSVMTECDRHAMFARSEDVSDDWEERISRYIVDCFRISSPRYFSNKTAIKIKI